MDDSTHLRCYYTPTVSFVLYHCTFPRIYVCTTHFAFTPLDDSTHLQCFCTPTGSFVLHHCTILRFYDAIVRRLAVLFYTTVRFYASTTLLYADWQFCFIPLYVSTHLRRYCTPTGSFHAGPGEGTKLHARKNFCVFYPIELKLCTMIEILIPNNRIVFVF